jgi:hypothetical protein
MMTVTPCELPRGALLQSQRATGAFTDCYCVELEAKVTQAAFVRAFYTTALFRLERLVLAWLARKPSTDVQAGELADGTRDVFAVWRVEQREPDQLLLVDQTGRTRSWLMIEPREATGAPVATRLYFGSALVPRVDRRTGRRSYGPLFAPLLGFHKLYSRALLRAAASSLMRSVGKA